MSLQTIVSERYKRKEILQQNRSIKKQDEESTLTSANIAKQDQQNYQPDVIDDLNSKVQDLSIYVNALEDRVAITEEILVNDHQVLGAIIDYIEN